jgi:hypothetical protein
MSGSIPGAAAVAGAALATGADIATEGAAVEVGAVAGARAGIGWSFRSEYEPAMLT